MKKKLLLILTLIILTPIFLWGEADIKTRSAGTKTDTNCDQAQYYPVGTLCQDSDDGKLYKGTGAAVVEIASGTIGLQNANAVAITGGNATGLTNLGASNATLTGGAISGMNITVADVVNMSVDWGMDSIMNSPDAAIKIQSIVGSNLSGNATPANVSYTTCTTSGAEFSNVVWGSGTQTATYTIANLTAGKLYRYQFTPAIASQVPTLTATSNITVASIPTLANATVANVYFRPSAANAVFTYSNTGASTWSTASTTVYEYSRPAIGREYINGGTASTQQTLVFDWLPPSDWDGNPIKITPYMVVSNATAPANGETIVWSFAGYCVGDSDSLSQALGTAVTSTYTAPNTLVQYDEVIGTQTANITLAGAAAGKKCRITVDRAQGTYVQKIALVSLLLKFTRVLAP